MDNVDQFNTGDPRCGSDECINDECINIGASETVEQD
jgi:hypothetical protein